MGTVKKSSPLAALTFLAAACSPQPQICRGLTPAPAERRAPAAVALAGRVTDEALVLSASQKLALDHELEQFERKTGHQMVVTTVKSLGGRDVADFTRDLVNSWGIGRRCYDDGIALLVAPNERKVRIAVGYGLEKTLTNELTQRIIDQHIAPAFRRGDLPGGIEAGTQALIRAAS